MDKKLLRKIILSKRDSVDIVSKANSDNIIKEKLYSKNYYMDSNLIFVYIGFGSEINTIGLIEDFIKDGKRVCVPKTDVVNRTMEPIEIVSLDGLEENKYGILEPINVGKAIDKNDIDLIVMPGVAFDGDGGRVGYGGGYYDKFIHSISKDITKVALAYHFQIIDKVPMEEHDIRVDYIITD